MPGPDAYPEMILEVAQEEIRELAHERARQGARAAGTGRSRWWNRTWWRGEVLTRRR